LRIDWLDKSKQCFKLVDLRCVDRIFAFQENDNLSTNTEVMRYIHSPRELDYNKLPLQHHGNFMGAYTSYRSTLAKQQITRGLQDL
jgi:hypothetical protein